MAPHHHHHHHLLVYRIVYFLLPLTSALTITSPEPNSDIDPGSPITITWTSSPNDPPTIDLTMLHPSADASISDAAVTTLGTNIAVSEGKFTVPAWWVLNWGVGFEISATRSGSGGNEAVLARVPNLTLGGAVGEAVTNSAGVVVGFITDGVTATGAGAGAGASIPTAASSSSSAGTMTTAASAQIGTEAAGSETLATETGGSGATSRTSSSSTSETESARSSSSTTTAAAGATSTSNSGSRVRMTAGAGAGGFVSVLAMVMVMAHGCCWW